MAWTIWKYWARFSGLLNIAALIGLGVVYATSNGLVWTSANVHLLTPDVKVGGKLEYTADFIAHQSCPSKFVQVIASVSRVGQPITVSFQRDVVHPGVTKLQLFQSIELRDLATEQGEGITAGLWDYTGTMVATCPLDEISEPVIRFRFRVVE